MLVRDVCYGSPTQVSHMFSRVWMDEVYKSSALAIRTPVCGRTGLYHDLPDRICESKAPVDGSQPTVLPCSSRLQNRWEFGSLWLQFPLIPLMFRF